MFNLSNFYEGILDFPRDFSLLRHFICSRKNLRHIRHFASVCNRHLCATRTTGLPAPVHTRLSFYSPSPGFIWPALLCLAWNLIAAYYIFFVWWQWRLWEHFPAAVPLSPEISAALLLFCETSTFFGSSAEVLLNLVQLNPILSVTTCFFVHISKCAFSLNSLNLNFSTSGEGNTVFVTTHTETMFNGNCESVLSAAVARGVWLISVAAPASDLNASSMVDALRSDSEWVFNGFLKVSEWQDNRLVRIKVHFHYLLWWMA